MRLAKFIDKTVRAARANCPDASGMSDDDLQNAIAGITETLKGPGLDFGERLTLNEDRRVFREALIARATHTGAGESPDQSK